MKIKYIVGGNKKFDDLDAALEYAQTYWDWFGVVLSLEIAK